MFTGDAEGDVCKWEQMQSNHIMYSSERLLKMEGKKDLNNILVQAISLGDKKSTNKDEQKDMKRAKSAAPNRIKSVEERLPAYYVRQRSAAKVRERARGIGGYVSQYSYLQQNSESQSLDKITRSATGKSILRILFVERFDLIIAACEDGNIYVWGFDLEALKALTTLREQASAANLIQEETVEVANRVVGFTLRKVFREHASLVTSLALVDDFDTFGGVFLISSGWDRRLCVWDLTHFILFSVYRNPNTINIDEAETASNGSIIDMDYSSYLKAFAYVATDGYIYVRKFSTRGSDMHLIHKLQIQVEAEATCIKWNYLNNQWIVGLENGEIRIWDENGDFKQAVNVRGSIHAIELDYVQKALLVGTQDSLKVFDMEEYICVQTNQGHSDVIRDIVFIPERNQYITVSLDQTMRIWNAWSPEPFRKKVKDVDAKTKFSQDLWDQIKNCVKNSVDVEDPDKIVEKYFENQSGQSYSLLAEDTARSRQVSFIDP